MPNDTARGFDAALIEAMARGMAAKAGHDNPEFVAPAYRASAKAALTALCAARPDVAALLAGEAVAVPREPTPSMLALGLLAFPEDEDRACGYPMTRAEWRAMLAASSYAKEPQA